MKRRSFVPIGLILGVDSIVYFNLPCKFFHVIVLPRSRFQIASWMASMILIFSPLQPLDENG